MSKKITLIKFFTFAGNFLVPIYALAMFFIFRRSLGGLLFALLISVMIVERAWETFKTSKEQRREELLGDWTLAAVTMTYLILIILINIRAFFLLEFQVFVNLFVLSLILIPIILLVFLLLILLLMISLNRSVSL